MKEKCKVCGEYFIKHGNQMTCSKACAYKNKTSLDNSYYKRKKQKKTTNNRSIEDINSVAIKSGMSYGKYVAMMQQLEVSS